MINLIILNHLYLSLANISATECGDGVCQHEENCGKCPQDCCPGNDFCSSALDIQLGRFNGSTDVIEILCLNPYLVSTFLSIYES